MSADEETHSGDVGREGGDPGTELARLNALHDDLVEAVQTAINPAVRADLTAELRSVRERIAELSMTDGAVRRPPDPGLTRHSYEVAPGSAPPNGTTARPDPAESGSGSYDAGPSAPADGYGRDAAYPSNPEGGSPGYARSVPSGPGTGGYDSYGSGGVPVEPRPAPLHQVREPGGRPGWFSRPWLPLLLAILFGLALAAFVGFGDAFGSGDDDETAEANTGVEAADPAGASANAAVLADIRAVLDAMGYGSVSVEDRDGSVALVGSVDTEAERQAVVGAAQALAGALPFDASGLVVAQTTDEAQPPSTEAADSSPAAAMQRELNRTLASTPIVFDQGQVAITDRHQVILNNVVATMNAYPGQQVAVVGFTDGQGTEEANLQLSLARAQNVKDYLVGQGVSADRLEIRGAGELDSTNLPDLAILERRVEFRVAGVAVAGQGGLRVGVVAPSDRADFAFTQSMIDALDLLATERDLQISITDNAFEGETAAAALRSYAEQGYDLVIAHGSQYGGSVQELANQYPGVAFAFGTASGSFGLQNVYSYDARAQEGGYVLGAMAAMLSQSSTIGVVGPIEIGDAELYINGFQEGAAAQSPQTTVRVDYIDSFSNIALAADSATAHAAAGADVMTGSAQMVVGAVEVAVREQIPWFGTQSNQAALAPELVVASQVYRWEVVLRPILDDVAAGRLAGTQYSLNLANSGLAIEYNDAYSLPPEIRQRGDELVGLIASGGIVPQG